MALNTNIKLFREGMEIYYVSKSEDNKYMPVPMKIDKILRGRVLIVGYDGAVIDCSLQSRRICFTYEECGCICSILSK